MLDCCFHQPPIILLPVSSAFRILRSSLGPGTPGSTLRSASGHLRLQLSLPSSLFRQLSLPQTVHPLQLLLDLVLVKWYLVGLFGRWPEAWYGEAFFEIRAEIVHPANGKENVGAELHRRDKIQLDIYTCTTHANPQSANPEPRTISIL